MDSLKEENWCNMGTLANPVAWSMGRPGGYNDKKSLNQIPWMFVKLVLSLKTTESHRKCFMVTAILKQD